MGMFITFEGADGVGKSTQARLFADWLADQEGEAVVRTREPGGSPGAETIRSLLVSGEPGRWSAETEILLFNAARRDHVERLIRPALERGEHIVCDRFVDSTRVYQGATRTDLRHVVDILHETMIQIEPDLTFVLDAPAEVSLQRTFSRHGDESRFESFGTDFQERLRAGFRALAQAHPERCVMIDAGGCVATVHDRILSAWRDRRAAPAASP